jgi:CubicO group peptidase (beta-lactamase class C family)
MKITKILWTCLLILYTLCNFHCSREQPLQLKTRVQAGFPIPESAMDTVLNEHHIPGVSIAVIHNGQIDWVKGYGVREYGRLERIDSNTLFQAASISKPISAVVALRLVDKRKIDLDEDVNLMLQSWKVPRNEFTNKQSVTIRRLLSHSAGLSMHGVPEFTEGDTVPTLVQILDGTWSAAKETVRVVVEPGITYRYSGGGYIILQLLLTDVTKRPFAELAQELVLQPVGMVSSTFEQPLQQHLWSRAAIGHLGDRKPMRGRWHTLPEQAAGGLWTTPRDLASFLIELWRSYKGISNKLLSQNLASQMLTRQIDEFGLGLLLPKTGVFRFQHGGHNDGYMCFMVLSVDVPNGVVIMMNGDSSESLIWDVFGAIAHAYGWNA